MTNVFVKCFKPDESPPRRRRIDPSMIGNPTNFVHTGHVGSHEVGNGSTIKSMESQMQTKGGYGQSPIQSHLHLIDVQSAAAM